MATPKICKIDRCGNPAKKRGWCNAHYLRWWKYGNPLSGGPSPRRGWPLDRILSAEVARAKRLENGCLIASCGRDGRGYPLVYVDGRSEKLSRLVLEKKLGRKLKKGELARHTCDIRACINPGHLIPGNTLDNSRDMVLRDRVSRPSAKIDESAVREIRDLYATGKVLQRDLAMRFGISRSMVSMIVNRERWAYVTPLANQRQPAKTK